MVPLIRLALIKDSSPWANNRLVFVGDYAEGIPDNLDTEEVEEALEENVMDIFGEDDIQLIAAEMQSRRQNPLYEMPSFSVGTKLERKESHGYVYEWVSPFLDPETLHEVRDI